MLLIAVLSRDLPIRSLFFAMSTCILLAVPCANDKSTVQGTISVSCEAEETEIARAITNFAKSEVPTEILVQKFGTPFRKHLSAKHWFASADEVWSYHVGRRTAILVGVSNGRTIGAITGFFMGAPVSSTNQ